MSGLTEALYKVRVLGSTEEIDGAESLKNYLFSKRPQVS